MSICDNCGKGSAGRGFCNEDCADMMLVLSMMYRDMVEMPPHYASEILADFDLENGGACSVQSRNASPDPSGKLVRSVAFGKTAKAAPEILHTGRRCAKSGFGRVAEE